MPKVHFVKKARKDNKARGIKKGDSYYWWSFMVGGRGSKRYSKTKPRPSQLTQSEYLSTVYGMQEEIDDEAQGVDGKDSFDEFLCTLKEKAEELRSFGGEQADKASNMESAFPSGNQTIDMLNERADACERIADELECAGDDDSVDDNDYTGKAIDLASNISWDTE